MKLSEIIAYKNLLEEITPLNSAPLVHDILNPVLKVVENKELQFEYLIQQLKQHYRYVHRSLNDFENTIEDIKTSIQKLIEQAELTYYKTSSESYLQDSSNETCEYIFSRKLPVFEEVIDKLVTRIQVHNNWKYAGMIIRPAHEEWIKYLVGCDPLYLVDQSDELTEPAVLRFNDQYQRRLRTYVINEDMDKPIFDQIPNAQLGICLVWNFFNYKPIEVIERYLIELYTKLKPGGTLAMTFNNCDRAEGTELFEKHFMSYTPGRAVVSKAESIGYVVTYNFRTDSSNTWLELQKPGQLTSLRGGQSLAKILYKDEYSLYTNEQIKNIKQQASDLNIVRFDELEKMPIGQIVELLKQRNSE